MGTSIELSTLLTIMGATFGLTTAVIAILVRMLLKSHRERVADAFNALRSEINARLQAFDKEVIDALEDRKDCEKREGKNMARLEMLCTKVQDQWIDFQKNTSSIETARGQKIEAMFRILDQQKNEVRRIRELMGGVSRE